ncbi:heme-binding protein [Halieaceae bacterium IMCC8485]|jgi:effector-binding domain-containing protein|uniref:Heme-binding protein n=1 Tax=Candidatus Seongchinamella marina TaxID=2518990 RepID=A0ABT3SVV4_9GAMM|nr:heme-binding protein [Candidatus Seongchinamella marina]MCX2974123.1 heme-binding protein [Candidatus Seongchinamella marina]
MKRFYTTLLALTLGNTAMASDIEEPSWTLVDTVETVELREYAPSIQAVTQLDHSGQTSAGFQRLAGFIFGGNETGEKIAMTAPVEESLEANQPLMAFTLPSEYELEDLPEPADDSVQIQTVPGRTMAAIRFSGWATDGKVKRNTQQLIATLKQHGIEAVGTPSLNQYNPPWTPPFLRRNEIMVEVQVQDAGA